LCLADLPSRAGGRRTGKNGLWFVAPGKVRYELERSDAAEDVRKAVDEKLREKNIDSNGKHAGTGSLSVFVEFPPEKYLGKDGLVLKYSSILGGGGIASPKAPAPPIVLTPWDMAEMMGNTGELNPADLILRAARNPAVTFKLGEPKLVEGRSLTPLVVEGPGDEPKERSQFTFLVDPQQGYLPLQMWHAYEGRIEHQGFITRVRRCSGSRWFPERIVTAQRIETANVDSRDRGRYFCRELTVTELDVDHPPQDKDFAIQVPAGAQFHNGIDPASAVYVDKPRTLRAEDIAGLLAYCDATAARYRALNPKNKSAPVSKATAKDSPH
jgi:hypothetical protein